MDWFRSLFCMLIGCKAREMRYSDLALSRFLGFPTEKSWYCCERCGLEWEGETCTTSFTLAFEERR